MSYRTNRKTRGKFRVNEAFNPHATHGDVSRGEIMSMRQREREEAGKKMSHVLNSPETTTRSAERIVGYPDGIWYVQTESTRQDLVQGHWMSMGRGFGYKIGWYVEGYGFFPTNSYSGSRPVPGTGAIALGDDKYLDLKTGRVYHETRKEIKVRPYEDQNTRMRVSQGGFSTDSVYVDSYAQAEVKGIFPRDEIIGTVYNPVNGKILAFEEGHGFSNVGRNMPVQGWDTYIATWYATDPADNEDVKIYAASLEDAKKLIAAKYKREPDELNVAV